MHSILGRRLTLRTHALLSKVKYTFDPPSSTINWFSIECYQIGINTLCKSFSYPNQITNEFIDIHTHTYTWRIRSSTKWYIYSHESLSHTRTESSFTWLPSFIHRKTGTRGIHTKVSCIKMRIHAIVHILIIDWQMCALLHQEPITSTSEGDCGCGRLSLGHLDQIERVSSSGADECRILNLNLQPFKWNRHTMR